MSDLIEECGDVIRNTTRGSVVRLYLAAEEWLHADGINVSVHRDATRDLDREVLDLADEWEREDDDIEGACDALAAAVVARRAALTSAPTAEKDPS